MGTCGALQPHLSLGDLVVARESICLDGASRALGGRERRPADPRSHLISGSVGDPVDLRSVADPGLTDALRSAAPHAHSGTIVSVDLFYEDVRLPEAAADALAVEMEAATLFALGSCAEIPIACVLAVSDTFDASGARTHIDDHTLLAAAESMGGAATSALSANPSRGRAGA
ncbi:MAG TPA: hypothetical protein VGI27_04460 [Solirubrobacteraceae bacterium]